MSQTELILLAIYKLIKSTNKSIACQHIIVAAYKDYPDIFHLKDYPEYPDSEQIKKRIYDNLKQRGFIRIVNNNIELTDFGVEAAQILLDKNGSMKTDNTKRLFYPREMKLYEKLVTLEGFIIFQKDKNFKPLDTDLYNFYGMSVRSDKSDIKSKVNIINDLLKRSKKLGLSKVNDLIDYKKELDILLREMKNNEY